jgi:methylamine dehydrogenase accessory protein MauD
METVLLVWNFILSLGILFLGFLIMGALRNLGLLRWRLELLSLTMPSRVNRGGLKPGKKAPDFPAQMIDGRNVSFHEYFGRKKVLVFMRAGCAPCHKAVPALNKLHKNGTVQVIVVFAGDSDSARKWINDVGALFPLLLQEKHSVSRLYEMYATPFAFFIDENGIIISRGVVSNEEHLNYLLSETSDTEPNSSMVMEQMPKEAP